MHERQAKRRAIHLVAKGLCSRGATPEQIAEIIPWRGSKLWRSTDGEVDAGEFAERMEADAKSGGLAWDPSRWHRTDDALIYSGGRTWAFSSGWGTRTGEAIEALLEQWPASGIEVRESAT